MNRIVVGCIVLMALFLGLFAMSVEPEANAPEALNLQDKLTTRADHVGLAQNTYRQR
jgi:hypothetical protein